MCLAEIISKTAIFGHQNVGVLSLHAHFDFQ